MALGNHWSEVAACLRVDLLCSKEEVDLKRDARPCDSSYDAPNIANRCQRLPPVEAERHGKDRSESKAETSIAVRRRSVPPGRSTADRPTSQKLLLRSAAGPRFRVLKLEAARIIIERWRGRGH